MGVKMKLISWNVNGIRAVASKDAFLWTKEFNPDIFCLQEIKAMPEQIPSQIKENSYLQTHINPAARKGYSGTMTFSNLLFNHTDTAAHIDIENEGRILEHHHEDVVIFNVYFPNGQQSEERLEYKMKFYNDFLLHCEKLKEDGKSIIVCGDVNTAHKEIDLANPKSNSKTSGFLPQERAWIDDFLSAGYVDTFRYVHGDVKDYYSWWSYRFNARAKNIGWRIDYVFISDDLKDALQDAFILEDITGSDHCPVGIEIDI
jgi:exodeoxyribonuclease-3